MSALEHQDPTTPIAPAITRFYRPTSIARLSSLAAVKTNGFMWNATPWHEPRLSEFQKHTMMEALLQDPDFEQKLRDREMETYLWVNIGSVLSEKYPVQLFAIFPNAHRDETLSKSGHHSAFFEFNRAWTDQVMLPALRSSLDRSQTANFAENFGQYAANSAPFMRMIDPESGLGVPIHHPVRASTDQLHNLWSQIEENIEGAGLGMLKEAVLVSFYMYDLPTWYWTEWKTGEVARSSTVDEARTWGVKAWREVMDDAFVVDGTLFWYDEPAEEYHSWPSRLQIVVDGLLVRDVSTKDTRAQRPS